MKGSLIILSFFVLGTIAGYTGILPDIVLENDFSVYILYGLMFLVGINIGYDKKTLSTLKNNKFKIILVPLATLIGTLAGCALVGVFIPKWSIFECMAVGSGFGYYSLSLNDLKAKK